MNQKINTDVNSINQKALLWWNNLSKDWKLTMIHNPNVNKTMQDSIVVIGKSTSMVRRMFINWLNWEMKKENEMKPKKEKWEIRPSSSMSVAGVTVITKNGDPVAEVYGSDLDARKLAKIMASAPAMLELLTKLRYQIENELLSTEIKLIDSIIAKVVVS